MWYYLSVYFDDGGRGANTEKGVILSVPNYDSESQFRLQIILKVNYGIDTTLHNKTGLRLNDRQLDNA